MNPKNVVRLVGIARIAALFLMLAPFVPEFINTSKSDKFVKGQPERIAYQEAIINQSRQKRVLFIPKEDYSYAEYPIDQIFRDHNGYRLLYTNASGALNETKVLDWGHCNYTHFPAVTERNKFSTDNEGNKALRIFKDLEFNQRGYCRTIRKEGFFPCNTFFYAEIHLPRDGKINPGINIIHRYKQRPLELKMQEIK